MSAYLRLSAIALAASLLAGCSNSSNSGSTTPPATSLTGNWFFTTLYPGNVPQNIVFSGALTQQGTSVTAVLHNSCFSNQDINFSGTDDATGNLSLASTNLPSNVVTIKGMVTITGGVVQTSGYNFTVTGSAPCALAATTLTGSQVPSFTGNFSGSLSTTTGGMASFTVAMTQGSANTDGEFPITGSVSVSSSACAVTFPLSLFFAGSGFTTNLTSATGPTSTAVFTAGPVVATTTPPLLANINIAITGCNSGTYTGSLNKQ